MGFASLHTFLSRYHADSAKNSNNPNDLLVGSENKIQIGVPMLTEFIGMT